MSDQDVGVIREAYEAFNRADIPAVLGAFDEQIAWTEPGGGKAPRGTFRGPASVANDVFATVPQQFTEFQAQAERFIDAADGRLVVTGTFRGRSKDGETLDTPFAHVWQMRNGKATSFEQYVAAEPWTRAWGG
jgi:ketosteroid isomerase-like protein